MYYKRLKLAFFLISLIGWKEKTKAKENGNRLLMCLYNILVTLISYYLCLVGRM